MTAETSSGSPSAALELRAIRKRFGDVTALDGVDLLVTEGSVHALLGENGAGKSTLMRIAFGLLAPDAGEINVFGDQRRGLTVRDATRAGLGMVHQHLSLAPSLTTSENLVLGGAGLFRPRDAVARLRTVAEASGLRVPLDVPARDLSIVQQQRLEILKALSRDARLLILDEPTAVLAPSEIDDLLAWVRDYAAEGRSVVLVTHKLREALAVADEITVLRRGRVTHVGPARDSTDAELARAIFPEAVAASPESPAVAPTEVVVSAENVTVAGAHGVPQIRHASFALHRHEIVGIAAIEGSGHRELLAALGALHPTESGLLRLPPRVVVIPADRQREGLIPQFSLAENVALLDIGAARGLLNWNRVEERTRLLMQRFSIDAPSTRGPARALSGGNQQRLVVARSLEHPVDLVVADNPTRGLDMQASAFVHEQLRRAAAGGAVVVVHSSDLDEVLALATRVLVVFQGEVRELGLDRDAIGAAMLGAA